MLRTFGRFLVVGASGVLLNSAMLFLLHQIVGLPLVVSSAMSVELAIANNFVWNDRWTFRETSRSFGRFLKFNLVSLLGLGVTAGTAWLLVQEAGMHFLVANLVGVGLASVCNFATNATWTWASGPTR